MSVCVSLWGHCAPCRVPDSVCGAGEINEEENIREEQNTASRVAYNRDTVKGMEHKTLEGLITLK